MKCKFGKYYLLDLNKTYWSIDLQRSIKFVDKLVVCCESTYQHKLYYGKLVDTPSVYSDMVTNNEIMFSPEDVIGEYKLQSTPLFFVDFIYEN